MQFYNVRRRKHEGPCRELERWTPRFAAYLGALYLPAVEALVVCGYRWARQDRGLIY